MRTNTARRLAVDPLEELRARLDACELAIRELRSRGASRDRQDAELRRVLAVSTEGLPFSAADLFAHAQLDPALSGALADATLQTAAEVGCWLRAHKGVCDGIAIERSRQQKWRVVYIKDMT